MGKSFLSQIGLMTIEDKNAIEDKLQILVDNVQALAKEVNGVNRSIQDIKSSTWEELQVISSYLSQIEKRNFEYNDEVRNNLGDIISNVKNIIAFQQPMNEYLHNIENDNKNCQKEFINLLESLQQCYEGQKKVTEEYDIKTLNFLTEITTILKAQYKNISCINDNDENLYKLSQSIDININKISENYVSKQDIKIVEDFLRLIIANQLMDNVDLSRS